MAIMRHEDNKSKGFGFVCYKDWQDAEKALTSFAEERAISKSGGLYVSEFKTKEQRELEI